MKINLIKNNFLYKPADIVLASSSVRGACTKASATMEQILKKAGGSFRMEFYETIKHMSGNPDSLIGTFYKMPTYGGLRTAECHFKYVCVCFHGGRADSLYKIFESMNLKFSTENNLSVTTPLIGTNVGGIPLKEWVEAVRKWQNVSSNISTLNICYNHLESDKIKLLKTVPKNIVFCLCSYS